MKLFLSMLIVVSCTTNPPSIKDINSIELKFSEINGRVQKLLLTRSSLEVREGLKIIPLSQGQITNLKNKLNHLNFLSWKTRDVKWKNFSQFMSISIFDGKSYITKELNDHDKERFKRILDIFEDYLFID